MAGFWDKRVKAIPAFKFAETFAEDWEKKTLSFELIAEGKPIPIRFDAFKLLSDLLGTDAIEVEAEGDNRYANEDGDGPTATTVRVRVASVVFPNFDKKG